MSEKFALDLSEYTVDVPASPVLDGEIAESGTIPYPIKENYAAWLRGAGIFRTGEDIAEAVQLAHTILKCKASCLEVDERQLGILKQCLNRLIELSAEGKCSPIGGPIHEEAICRVFNLK